MDDHARVFGWRVVWAAFLIAVFVWGIGFYGPPVFLQILHADHGWAISTISSAITMHFLVGAALVAFLPNAHRRLGIAAVTQIGVVLLALGIVAWANVREPWQMFAAAVLSGAGWAATSGAALNAIVAPWFDQDRPKALSLAFNGASVGGLVLTPTWVALIARFGVASAATVIAATAVIVLTPIIARFLRPQPAATRSTARNRYTTTFELDRLRDRRFITISAAFALGLFAQIGLFAHLVARLGPELGSTAAAWAISLMSVCAVIGRMFLGWLVGDRNRRAAAALNFLVQACGTGMLMLGGSVLVLLSGCILFGFGVGNLTSAPPIIVQEEFAAADVNKTVALIVAINQAVFAFAPAAFGALHDLQGGYMLPFGIAASLQVAAALIVIANRPG